jgi:hypothetical protein
MLARSSDTALKASAVLSISIAFACVCGCQRSDDAADTQPAEGSISTDAGIAPGAAQTGHDRMLRTLAQIAEATPDEHPYLGTRQARQLRKQLRNLSPDTDSYARWQLLTMTAHAELYAGDVDGAIRHLTQAYELVPAEQFKQPPGNLTRFQLAVAYMRMGTTRNCCVQPMARSCIVPFGKTSFPRRQWSEKAIRHLSDLLDDTPPQFDVYVTARWLLNIAHMTLGGYPNEVPPRHRVPTSVFESQIDFPRFENVALQLRLPTFSLAGGVIVDDFDNDDHLDIVTSTWDPAGQMRFFRNNRDGTFTDRTEEAGLLGFLGGLNMVQADYDNDGWLDILVLRGAWAREAGRHPNSLLRNGSDGTFTDVTFQVGLGDVHYPTQTAAWGDYDNDGDLDLYIGNETSPSGGVDSYTGRESEIIGFEAPCQLFRNNGDGSFTDVAGPAGVENRGYSKGVAWGDFDGDRDLDLYVSNLMGPNRLYRNNGDGTFTDVAEQLRVTRPIVSFPTWFWDFDNDGTLDIFACPYTGRVNDLAKWHLGSSVPIEVPCLYWGDGRGGFIEVAADMNLARPVLPMGSNFGDLDDDGWLDFYLGTGDPNFETLMPNLMFVNQGGKRFVDVTMAGGFGHLQKGHGVAFADIDNDGDTDVYEEMGGAFYGDEFYDVLYVNPGFGHRWLGVRLIGVQSNRSAIGARIRVQVLEDGSTRSVYRHVTSGGSFGASPLRQHIGLGRASSIRQLEIFWPTTGRTQVFENIQPDQTIQIVEGEGRYTRLELVKVRLGWRLESQ